MSELLIIATHAIQYQVPLFQYLSKECGADIHVAFLEEPATSKPYWDIDFNKEVIWDIPLVSGYHWSVVPSGNLQFRLHSFAELHRKLGKPPIMLTSWGTSFHWLVWTWAVVSKIPVFLSAETNQQSYLMTPKPILRRYWLKFLIRHTQGLLYIGTRNRDFYSWMGAEKKRFFSYPYSIDNERFYSNQKKFLATKKNDLLLLGLSPQLPTILFCGKLISKKRPDLLLKSIHNSNLNGKVNALFVGDGILRPVLEKIVIDLQLKNVAFTGFFNQMEMPKAYALGDILCLLSDQPSETWGLAVNEAQACGRPVIVSDVCGCVPDLVENKNTGWIVKSGSLSDTSQILSDAYNNSQFWSKIGLQGQSIIEGHTFQKMAIGIQTALAVCHKD
ncbi:MAG: glycosyltransferase [Chloroflexi bacterium]|nr:glycosyltransferase [Chloroflexota bacterium]